MHKAKKLNTKVNILILSILQDVTSKVCKLLSNKTLSYLLGCKLGAKIFQFFNGGAYAPNAPPLDPPLTMHLLSGYNWLRSFQLECHNVRLYGKTGIDKYSARLAASLLFD